MKSMKLAGIVVAILCSSVSAFAQGWAVAIEENPMVTTCGANKNVPVAGATDCDTAKKAAWDLLQLLQAGGCVGSGCPAGSVMTPGEVTCKYDPYTRPNGSQAKRWQINWKWTCPRIGPPCCKCLGETTSVDLSTGQSSPIDSKWQLNGGNAYTTPPYPGWITTLTPAKWIQPVASPTPSPTAPANTVFKYTLQFTVPKCTIPRDVRLQGSFAADNSAKVFLDGNPIASCAGPKCFAATSAGGQAPVALNASISPGNHTLEIQVSNLSGPSGLIVNAQLKTQCKKD